MHSVVRRKVSPTWNRNEVGDLSSHLGLVRLIEFSRLEFSPGLWGEGGLTNKTAFKKKKKKWTFSNDIRHTKILSIRRIKYQSGLKYWVKAVVIVLRLCGIRVNTQRLVRWSAARRLKAWHKRWEDIYIVAHYRGRKSFVE